jgi:hypothetical protein
MVTNDGLSGDNSLKTGMVQFSRPPKLISFSQKTMDQYQIVTQLNVLRFVIPARLHFSPDSSNTAKAIPAVPCTLSGYHAIAMLKPGIPALTASLAFAFKTHIFRRPG